MVQSALANADVPFQQIVIDANVPRSASYTPLFQTIFTLEDASFDTSFELDGAAVDGAEARRAEGPAMSLCAGCFTCPSCSDRYSPSS